MMRKVLLSAVVGALALGLTFSPADAAAKRVKGKFKPAESGSPVLGSAKVKPTGANVHRVGLTLQHVWRTDYTVYVGSFVDANGNGLPEVSEQQEPQPASECSLVKPSKKGHAGCVGEVSLEGTPYVVYLAVPDGAGVAFEAWAYVK